MNNADSAMFCALFIHPCHHRNKMKSTGIKYLIRFIHSLGAVLIYILLLAGAVIPLRPIGTAIPTWSEKTDNGWVTKTIPIIEKNKSENQVLVLRTEFSRSSGNTLVIPRQSGNAIEVLLNGKVVYTCGEPGQPTGNLWNYVHLIHFTEPLLEHNSLVVRLYSSHYAVGFNNIPYITDYRSAAERAGFLNWLYNDLLLLASGAALIIGALLFVLAFVRHNPWDAEFFMGCGLIFSVAFAFDGVFRYSTGSLVEFLWIKKLFMSSGYIASLCFICCLERYYYKRLTLAKWIAGLTATSLMVLVSAPNLISLSNRINYANLVLLINLTAVILLILTNRKSRSWMLLPAVLLCFSILQVILSIPLHIFWPSTIYIVLLITTILFGGNLVIEFNQLYLENIVLRQEKNIDPLTGVMNRNILKDLSLGLYDYVAMLDMDNFKQINDTYGHALGDELLIKLAQILRRNLRQSDLIIRYGGDEFALVLGNMGRTDNTLEGVNRILERIARQYASINPEMALGFSYGVGKIDGDISTALVEADQKMYVMKSSRKVE
jgi:diguanylate cyclase (GGDEF)-like protein